MEPLRLVDRGQIQVVDSQPAIGTGGDIERPPAQPVTEAQHRAGAGSGLYPDSAGINAGFLKIPQQQLAFSITADNTAIAAVHPEPGQAVDCIGGGTTGE